MAIFPGCALHGYAGLNRMARDPRGESLTELIASLARDIPELLDRQVRLAKADAALLLGMLLSAMRRLALGSVIGVGAVAVLLAALVSGLAAILIALGFELALAACIAAGIVAIIAGAISAALIWSAVSTMKAARSSLEESIQTLSLRTPEPEEQRP